MPGVLKRSKRNTHGQNNVEDIYDKLYDDGKVNLIISTSPGDHIIVITCNADSTMARLKRACSDLLGVEVDEMCLEYKGEIVQDDDTPEKLGLVDSDNISLTVK